MIKVTLVLLNLLAAGVSTKLSTLIESELSANISGESLGSDNTENIENLKNSTG